MKSAPSRAGFASAVSGWIVSRTAAPTNTPEPSLSAVASSGGSVATPDSPWYSDETYLLKLINCTRTGGWVTSAGASQ